MPITRFNGSKARGTAVVGGSSGKRRGGHDERLKIGLHKYEWRNNVHLPASAGSFSMERVHEKEWSRGRDERKMKSFLRKGENGGNLKKKKSFYIYKGENMGLLEIVLKKIKNRVFKMWAILSCKYLKYMSTQDMCHKLK